MAYSESPSDVIVMAWRRPCAHSTNAIHPQSAAASAQSTTSGPDSAGNWIRLPPRQQPRPARTAARSSRRRSDDGVPSTAPRHAMKPPAKGESVKPREGAPKAANNAETHWWASAPTPGSVQARVGRRGATRRPPCASSQARRPEGRAEAAAVESRPSAEATRSTARTPARSHRVVTKRTGSPRRNSQFCSPSMKRARSAEPLRGDIRARRSTTATRPARCGASCVRAATTASADSRTTRPACVLLWSTSNVDRSEG